MGLYHLYSKSWQHTEEFILLLPCSSELGYGTYSPRELTKCASLGQPVPGHTFQGTTMGLRGLH